MQPPTLPPAITEDAQTPSKHTSLVSEITPVKTAATMALPPIPLKKKGRPPKGQPKFDGSAWLDNNRKGMYLLLCGPEGTVNKAILDMKQERKLEPGTGMLMVMMID